MSLFLHRANQWTEEFEQSKLKLTSEPRQLNLSNLTYSTASNVSQDSSTWAEEYLKEVPIIENSIGREASKLSGDFLWLFQYWYFICQKISSICRHTIKSLCQQTQAKYMKCI